MRNNRIVSISGQPDLLPDTSRERHPPTLSHLNRRNRRTTTITVSRNQAGCRQSRPLIYHHRRRNFSLQSPNRRNQKVRKVSLINSNSSNITRGPGTTNMSRQLLNTHRDHRRNNSNLPVCHNRNNVINNNNIGRNVCLNNDLTRTIIINRITTPKSGPH